MLTCIQFELTDITMEYVIASYLQMYFSCIHVTDVEIEIPVFLFFIIDRFLTAGEFFFLNIFARFFFHIYTIIYVLI